MPEAMSATTLGIDYLDRYRRKMLGRGREEAGTSDDLDFALLNGLGLGLLETTRYLHAEKPALEQFEHWILEVNGGAIARERLERLRRALAGETVGPEVPLDGVAGLSAEELTHWDE